MRVKTVPRHRIVQNSENVKSVPEATTEDFEKSSNKDNKKASENMENTFDNINDCNWEAKRPADADLNKEKKKESLNFSTEALDMTIKRKDNTTQRHSNHCPTNPPNCCQYSNQPLEKDTWRTTSEDKNNNTLPSRMDIGNYCSLAGPSNSEHAKLHKDESNACVDDNNDTTEVMNLCKKDCYEEDATNHSGDCDERLKDTFLYKIMTDPTFLESIQKHKQPKKFACQFCKQEFANDEELTEHMDVKKDESNQVVCCACRKTFAQKRYLRYHQRCHSERAKFTCDICTKKYTRLDNLTRHNTFHVNPDKFSCSYCEKTFARKDLLNKHLKCHDNKYRFYCESCQKYFKGPLTLDNHKKIFHSVT